MYHEELYEDVIDEYAELITMKYGLQRISYERCETLLDKLEEWERHAGELVKEAIALYGDGGET